LYKEIFSNEENFISITPIDFNKDSRMDVIIESNLLNVYVDPTDGGTIFELDYKPESYNLLNTLTRWPEAYHSNDDIDELEVAVDRHKKNMFRLRLFPSDTSITLLEADQYKEYGSFIDGEFEAARMHAESAQKDYPQAGKLLSLIDEETKESKG